MASLNLWRLRDARRDAEYDEPLPSGVVDARLDAIAAHVAGTLSLPHVVAVQEVENLTLLRGIAERLRNAGAPDYEAFLLEGNDPSGIDVGLLVRPPVKLAGTRQLFAEVGSGRGYPLYSRPPLHAVMSAPFAADIVVVHLRSGRELDRPEVRARRRHQAQRLREWALTRHRAGRAVILLGDFNSAGGGPYGEPLDILTNTPFLSIWNRLPESERFSYIHRCRRQAIDNILFNTILRERAEAAAVSRGEAGHFRRLHGSGGTGEVITDHDAPVLYLNAGTKKNPLATQEGR